MSDNPSIRGDGDRQRINVDQEYEVKYWTRKLGISADELRAAVKQVGLTASAVERHVRSGNANAR